jgi:aminopeptidase N
MRLALSAALLVLAAPSGSTYASAQQPPTLAFEPVRYALDLTIHYDQATLEGSARITVRNRSSRPETDVPLLLYRLLHVSQASDGHGRALGVTQAVTSVEGFPQLQVNAITVSLAHALAPGDTITVAVDYAGYLLGYRETGMLYVQDRIDTTFTIIRDDAYAYPTLGLPSIGAMHGPSGWHFHYVARVTVPSTLVVANGGRLLERSERDGLVSYTYEDRLPAWRLDLAIARYGVLGANATRVYYLPGDSAGAAGVLRAVHNAMRLYGEWFGPLKTQTGYAVIEIPDGWGSQADRTAIIQTAAAFRDSSRWTEVYHEVSHQWNVDDLDPAPCRWNEGLAMFLQYLTAERLQGQPTVAEGAAAALAALERRFAQRPGERTVPMAQYGKAGLTDLSYRSGMLMFAVLYGVVGEEQFHRIIGGFYQRYAASGATTDDLVNYAKATASADLTRFFDDWLYTSRWTEHLRSGATLATLVNAYRP